MSSDPAAGLPHAAYRGRRVEVYGAAHGPDGRLRTVSGLPGRIRLPGVVLAHGESPRGAARRALATLADAPAPVDDDLFLIGVHSLVRPGSDPSEDAEDPERLDDAGYPGLHVLRVVLGVGASPAGVDDTLLVDPAPAPVVDVVRGAPPRVQRPAAYAVIRSRGRLLLSRVAGSGVWTLPGGGIDHGEHPDEAVRRETFEETGLRLVEARLVDVDSLHFTGHSPTKITEDFHGVRLVYSGCVDPSGEPVVQEIGGSTDAAAWVSPDRLDGMRLSAFVRTALAMVR